MDRSIAVLWCLLVATSLGQPVLPARTLSVAKEVDGAPVADAIVKIVSHPDAAKELDHVLRAVFEERESAPGFVHLAVSDKHGLITLPPGEGKYTAACRHADLWAIQTHERVKDRWPFVEGRAVDASGAPFTRGWIKTAVRFRQFGQVLYAPMPLVRVDKLGRFRVPLVMPEEHVKETEEVLDLVLVGRDGLEASVSIKTHREGKLNAGDVRFTSSGR